MQADHKVLLEPLIGYKQVIFFSHPITARATGVESEGKKKRTAAGHIVLLEPHWLQIRRNFFPSSHQPFDQNQTFSEINCLEQTFSCVEEKAIRKE